MDTRLFEIRNGLSFLECLEAAIQTDIVKEWERLSGKKLIASSPIERMIDEATGYDKEVLKEFIDFIYNFVFFWFGESRTKPE